MMEKRAYLDHNATAPVRAAVVAAVARTLENVGNPSSIHGEGRAARARLETAREQVAALVGARASDVVFTSGGTEGANAVLAPALQRDGAFATHLFAVATEHACVLDGHRFAGDRVTIVPVDGHGIVDLDWLGRKLHALAADEPRAVPLLSIQAANNETGVLQPVRAAADLVHAAGGIVHSDAVQAVGRLPVSLAALGADVVTLSGHKIGGPQGIGAIVTAGPHVHLAAALLRGGGQEGGWRAGTQNVPGAVGFGVAAELAAKETEAVAFHTRRLRDALEARILDAAPQAVIFGGAVERLPNTTCFAVPGLKAETLLMRYDLEGIAVSSGSACSSGKVGRSRVLAGMGVASSLSEGAIRVSLGGDTTEQDTIRCAATLEKALAAAQIREKAIRFA